MVLSASVVVVPALQEVGLCKGWEVACAHAQACIREGPAVPRALTWVYAWEGPGVADSLGPEPRVCPGWPRQPAHQHGPVHARQGPSAIFSLVSVRLCERETESHIHAQMCLALSFAGMPWKVSVMSCQALEFII